MMTSVRLAVNSDQNVILTFPARLITTLKYDDNGNGSEKGTATLRTDIENSSLFDESMRSMPFQKKQAD